ncbi:YmzC family protein [Bacillus cereus group sp. RP43]|uniref:YmzC family protein n=1 Tax=Bacillus cereus group TaxID=86661 RepID=UPI0011A73ABF|nr:YmzC family protein [Bacillus mycoides]
MVNTVSRELRNIRIYLIILIIVIAFWDREKPVEITDHGSDPILNTSNMTQVGDNTFAYKIEEILFTGYENEEELSLRKELI